MMDCVVRFRDVNKEHFEINTVNIRGLQVMFCIRVSKQFVLVIVVGNE
jgi:hypothetical protein